MMKGLALLLALVLALTACAGEPEPIVTTLPTTLPATLPTVPTEPAPTEPPLSDAELLLQGMTLRQKVGQLFVVAPEALAPESGTVTAFSEELEQGLGDYPVGGIILFADNLTDPDQLTALTGALGQAGETPLFLSVDEEGGMVARLANHSGFSLPRYDSAASVGSSGNPEDAYDMGRTIGTYLAQYGFNLNFAPVADVNTNPRNPVIGKRAFSSDPEMAAAMASAAARGLKDAGISPCYKHFPGHGDTAEDSHAGLAVSWKTEEELEACEWIPFREAGVGDLVMVGHVAVPELTGDMTPATMSSLLVTEKLRGELGFSGLVITDSLQMGAVTDCFTSGEAALLALKAGCDILLMPEDLPEAFEAVLDAVASGELDEEVLNRAVLRILQFKLDAGLIQKA